MIEHNVLYLTFYLHCRFVAHQTIDYGLRLCMCFLALNGAKYFQILCGAMRQLSKSLQLLFILIALNQLRFVMLVVICL